MRQYVQVFLLLAALLVAGCTAQPPENGGGTDNTPPDIIQDPTACTDCLDEKALIHIEVNTIELEVARPVNTKLFGSGFELQRGVNMVPVELDDESLRGIIADLKPAMITIDNNDLGIPFFPESTGSPAQRLTIRESLERIAITSDPLGRQLYDTVVTQDPAYANPPKRNYDDFLQFFEEAGVETEFSLRIPVFFTDIQTDYINLNVALDPRTGADLVHYLNDDPSGELGQRRAQNGHPDPYNVKYFVLGNEYWNNYLRAGLRIEDIAAQYIAFSEAMKAADPTIQIGIALADDGYPEEFLNPASIDSRVLEYNDKLLEQVAGHIDFVTRHVYIRGVTDFDEDNPEALVPLTEDQWRYVMADNYLKEKYGMEERHQDVARTYHPDLETAVDEFGGPLGSLGGALYNADFLIYLLNHDYAFATNWHLGFHGPDTRFGLIREIASRNDVTYAKRPTAYVLELFTSHFGDMLAETTMTSPAFDSPAVSGSLINWPAEEGVPSINTIASLDGDILYLMVINRELHNGVTATISLDGFSPAATAKVYTLTGPAIDATNEEDPDNVKITETAIGYAADSFAYNFEKHSVTVIELTRK